MNEAAHRHLIGLYTRSGLRTAALHQYDECVQMLEKEFGVTPDEATVRIYNDVREKRVPVERPAPHRDSPVPAANMPHQLTSFVGRERELA